MSAPLREARTRAVGWIKRSSAAAYGWASRRGGLRLPAGQFLVVAFHRIAAADDGSVALRSLVNADADGFDRMVDFLARRFHVASLEAVRDALERRAPLPPNSVLLTFDDGYRDFLTGAWPVLRARGLPCAIFPTTAGLTDDPRPSWIDQVAMAVDARAVPAWLQRPEDHRFLRDPEALKVRLIYRLLDGPGAWLDRLADEPRPALRAGAPPAYLTAEDLRGLDASVAIGSHGMSHRVLSALDPRDAAEELARSKAMLERASGRPVDAFAFPVGRARDLPDGADELLRAHGYRLGFTMQPGRNAPGAAYAPYRLRRVAAGRSLDELAFQLLRTVVSRS